MLYQAPWLECFGFSRLRLDWSIQIQKSGILVSPMGVLSNRHTRGRSWEMETLQGPLGSHVGNLHLLMMLWLLSRAWMRELVSVSGPCRPLGQTESMPREQYLGAA